jgi:hypothetical protein
MYSLRPSQHRYPIKRDAAHRTLVTPQGVSVGQHDFHWRSQPVRRVGNWGHEKTRIPRAYADGAARTEALRTSICPLRVRTSRQGCG